MTKYRRHVLRGKIGVRARDLIRQVYMARDIKIIKGHMGRDHVPLQASVPPVLPVP